jgi:hypothetical protein
MNATNIDPLSARNYRDWSGVSGPVGSNDDLVMALALACWGAKQAQPQPGFGPQKNEGTMSLAGYLGA